MLRLRRRDRRHKKEFGVGRCRCSIWRWYEEGGWYHHSFTPTVLRLASRAERHIERVTNEALDAASDVGQLFDNVKHMEWFRYAVMDQLGDWR